MTDLEDLHRYVVYAGDRMRQLRRMLGVKQSTITVRIGVHPSITSLWEDGRRPIPLNRIPELAAALEVDVPTLLDGMRLEVLDAAHNIRRATLEAPGAKRGPKTSAPEVPEPTSRRQMDEMMTAMIGIMEPEPVSPVLPPLAPLEDLPPIGAKPFVRAPAPPLPPPERRLLWCSSTHGVGVLARRHHHGPLGTLHGPVMTIDEWVRS